MAAGVRLVDKYKVVPAFFAAVPSAAAPTYVSMKGYQNLTIILHWKNGASGATGSAITVNQAKFVNGNGAKAVGFDTAWVSNDTANSVALTQLTVASNTFTTDNTANGLGIGIIEINSSKLDMANGFTALNVGLANATNSTVEAVYIMGGPAYYGGGTNSFVNPIAD